MLHQIGCQEGELRLERVRYVEKEGRDKYGCPVAKYVRKRKKYILFTNKVI